jgi:hypothetical protein
MLRGGDAWKNGAIQRTRRKLHGCRAMIIKPSLASLTCLEVWNKISVAALQCIGTIEYTIFVPLLHQYPRSTFFVGRGEELGRGVGEEVHPFLAQRITERYHPPFIFPIPCMSRQFPCVAFLRIQTIICCCCCCLLPLAPPSPTS